MVADVSAMLEQAAAALAHGQRGEGLRALLEAWRVERSAELRDCISALGEEAARGLSTLVQPRQTQKALAQAWLTVALRRQSVDVPRLLSTVAHPPWTRFRERVDQLERFPVDPRIGRWAAEFIGEMPVLSSVPDSGWRALLRLIEVSGDSRARAPLAFRAHQPARGLVESDIVLPGCRQLLERLPEGDPPSRDPARLANIRKEIERLAQGPPATAEQLAVALSADGLLEPIFARPADDAPRQVYADWLLERGDLRGELISLQLRRSAGARASVSRERELIKTHLKAWLGPLEPVVVRQSVRFERGFLSACATVPHAEGRLEELGDHPWWSTLTALVDVAQQTSNHALLAVSELRGLERIDSQLSARELGALSKRKRSLPRLTWLWAGLSDVGVLDPALLPALATLRLTASSPAAVRMALDPSRVLPQLKALELTSLGVELTGWLDWLASRPGLERVSLGDTFRWVRGGERWQLEVHRVEHVGHTANRLATFSEREREHLGQLVISDRAPEAVMLATRLSKVHGFRGVIVQTLEP